MVRYPSVHFRGCSMVPIAVKTLLIVTVQFFSSVEDAGFILLTKWVWTIVWLFCHMIIYIIFN